jgi:hypothetical protein
MPGRPLQLTVTADIDIAAEAAYVQFVAHNANPKPYRELSQMAQQTWQRVAAAVLLHVRAKDAS